MNIGFYACIVLVPLFLIIGLLFGIFKEKSAKFISGFNSLTKEQQALYDKEKWQKICVILALFGLECYL